MKELTLSVQDRIELMKQLGTAKVIMARAEKKYRTQSTGGHLRALEALEAAFDIITPPIAEQIEELFDVVNRMAPGSDKQAALRIAYSLKRLLSGPLPPEKDAEFRGLLQHVLDLAS